MPRQKRQVEDTTPPKPIKAKPLPALSSSEDLLKRFADHPNIDVISRRFNNPDDPGSLPILLKDEDPHCCVNSDHQIRLRPAATKCHLCGQPARRWYVRWTNTSIEGRWSTMKSKAYTPVEIGDLADEADVADLVRGGPADKYARRGDRGQEILVKQPLEIYNHIKRLQRNKRDEQANSAHHLRAELAESAGAELGDEAGQLMHDGAIKVESYTRSRTTLGEEAGIDDQ
jgi:hypothetical protein